MPDAAPSMRSGPMSPPVLTTVEDLHALIARVEDRVVGQRRLIEQLVVALLAEGHVLIEGVPGLAKTRTITAMASALNLPFRRISFTPDLLPADLTGTQVFRPDSGTFDLQLGPIHTSILLADEINRAPAKVQSALLEAMQERRVTIGDRILELPETFWVLATQNPIEQEGTYPLPEAQLDRFLFKLVVRYPERESELAMLALNDLQGRPASKRTEPLLNAERIGQLRDLVRQVQIVPAVREYLVDLVRATRDPTTVGLDHLKPMIELGASPRATVALFRAAQAQALLAERDYVTPHDVKSIAHNVLRHRILPSFEADAEGLDAEALISCLLDTLRVP